VDGTACGLGLRVVGKFPLNLGTGAGSTIVGPPPPLAPPGGSEHTWVRVWVIAACSFGGIIDVAVLLAASAVWERIQRFLWLRCGDDGCVSLTTTQAALGIALHTS